jgi:hypothetical protein
LVLLKEHSAWSKVRSSTDDIIVVTCEAAGQVPQETVTPQGFIPDAILIAPQLNLLEVKPNGQASAELETSPLRARARAFNLKSIIV